MSASKPCVYLFHGENELAISEAIAGMHSQLGDASLAEMNTTRLDGRSLDQEALVNAVRAAPFLAARRLVLLTHPTARLQTPTQRDSFLKILKDVPPTTALVLIEDHILTTPKDRDKKKLHWLERWAEGAGEGVLVRAFPIPSGPQMVGWIRERAKALGGEFTPQAAVALADLVGEDPRLAQQEIEKLLMYVSRSRPVEVADVERLSPLTAPVGDFALVNAVRAKNQHLALELLERTLLTEDPLAVFQSLVRQFRMVLLARELLDQGRKQEQIQHQVAECLGINPYAVRYAVDHARRFSLPALEAIYRRLLENDLQIKTGQTEADLALETLLIELTS